MCMCWIRYFFAIFEPFSSHFSSILVENVMAEIIFEINIVVKVKGKCDHNNIISYFKHVQSI